jgi:hypothetical protein
MTFTVIHVHACRPDEKWTMNSKPEFLEQLQSLLPSTWDAVMEVLKHKDLSPYCTMLSTRQWFAVLAACGYGPIMNHRHRSKREKALAFGHWCGWMKKARKSEDNTVQFGNY